ncbi:MAG: Flp pilus assembly protein CpaB [Propionivibrio sp.]|nr:Flp pilus assembly protein CpaB [Hydrogenophilales bacterium]MBP6421995.1 Flp pilus assembly protein CpaB [Propionivibrio sp.]
MGKTQKIIGLVLILLALGLGGYAWILSSRMAAEQQAAQPKMQPVVVALNRIPAGIQITPEMLGVLMFPTRPTGAYADVDSVAGNVASADIAVGEAILQERLGGGIRAMLQHLNANERAVAVRVDEVIAVGNRLAPGDRVDVFLTLHRNSDEISSTQSRLLLEQLQVLALGSKDVGGAKAGADNSGVMRPAAENPKTAVLAVNAADIDKLVLAAESGHLILALRPINEPKLGDPASMPTNTGLKDPLATTATKVQKPLTLKQLVAITGEPSGNSGSRIMRSATNVRIGHEPGSSVIVMHGLSEKTVNVNRTLP